MLLADSHITMVVGVDVHVTTASPFNHIHPYIWMVMVPADYIPYDNRLLLSAQNACITELDVELVNPSEPFLKSTKGKTWGNKFKERFNDKRNKKAGGVIPSKGLKSKPVLACS